MANLLPVLTFARSHNDEHLAVSFTAEPVLGLHFHVPGTEELLYEEEHTRDTGTAGVSSGGG
jgi:hypothetical protein